MAFGQLKAKDELVFGQGRDRLARQNDLAERDRHVQSPTGSGRQNSPFARLLGDHAAIRAHRSEVAFGDVEVGPGLIELGLRADAASLQFRHPVEVGLGLVALRLLGSDS